MYDLSILLVQKAISLEICTTVLRPTAAVAESVLRMILPVFLVSAEAENLSENTQQTVLPSRYSSYNTFQAVFKAFIRLSYLFIELSDISLNKISSLGHVSTHNGSPARTRQV